MNKQTRHLFFIVPLFLCVFCGVARAYEERDTATITIMDKASGKTQTATIPVGRTAEYEKISITIRNCKQSDPFQAENFYAFAEISKNGSGQIFGGWMNRNEPGANPLQDADYDVWLVSCGQTTDEN